MDKNNVAEIHNRIVFNSKAEEIRKFGGKWIELEKGLLSEVTQAYKDKYYIFAFIHRS